MKNALRIFLPLLFLAAFGAGLFYAAPAFAQTLTDAQLFGGGLSGSEFAQIAGLGGGDIRVIIARLIRTVLTFLGIVTVGIVLYGGFVYMMSSGEAAKVDKAKKIILNGVIGLVIVFSSFAITQFVLNSLVNAIQGKTTPDYCLEHPTEPACTRKDPDGTLGRFLITDTTTECAEGLRNPLIQFGFNSSPDLSTAISPKNGLKIKTGGNVVAGTWTASGQTLTFTPEATCVDLGLEYADVHCFSPNTIYEVVVEPLVLKSATGLSLTCDMDHPCDGDAFEFTTGTGVDLTAPTVSMQDPKTGDSAYVGTPEPLQAYTLDDTGVASVQFYAEGGIVDTAGLSDSVDGEATAAPEENYFNGQWVTNGYVAGQTYSLSAVGSDCGGNQTISESVEIPLRGSHCDNEVKDGGSPYFETGIDCGGTGQYSCGNCEDEPCIDDAQCASGECVEGFCVATLEIEEVSPGDGASGNLITILGNGFGTTPGTVTFYGLDADATDNVVHLPFTSAQCTSTWNDKSVVIQLGSTDVDGPIGLTTAAGKTDRTDDDNGSVVRDFDVNNIVRPGICQLNPKSAASETQIVVSGVGLGTGQGLPLFYFGSTASDQLANWGAGGVTFSALVPLLEGGLSYDTQYFYGQGANRQGSNILPFAVLKSAAEIEPPVISYIDTGVSLNLCSNTAGLCTKDGDCAGLPAEVCEARACPNGDACPATNICEDADATPCGLYCPGDTPCDTVGAVCPGTGTPSGTCEDVSGTGGPVGQYVTIYGTNFGDTEGTVIFNNNIPGADSNGYKALGDNEFPAYCDVDSWTDSMIVVKVPATYNLNYDPNAVPPEPSLPFETGAHKLWVVRDTDPPTPSNEVDFTVLSGDAGPSICGLTPTSGPVGTMVTIAGERFGMEADGSVMFMDTEVTEAADEPITWSDTTIIGYVPDGAKTGPVRVISDGNRSNPVNYSVGVCDVDFSCGTGEECCTNGACAIAGQQCELPPGEAYYTYFFSTDEIPVTPNVITDCTPPVMSPTPWEQWDAKVCLNAAVSARFDMAMDPLTLTSGNITVANVDTGAAVPMTFLNPTTTESGGTKFTANPVGLYAPNSHFRVTLKGNPDGNAVGAIKSVGGLYLPDDYSWDFYTAPADTLCTIAKVYNIPETYTATIPWERVNYSVLVKAEGYECVEMASNSAGLSWTWSNTPYISASEPVRLTPSANRLTAVAECNYERPVGSPVTISVKENSSGATGIGLLYTRFIGLKVSNYFPNCSTGCLNAVPWVEFNIPLNTAGNYLDKSKFTIYQCLNANCGPTERVSTVVDYYFNKEVSYDAYARRMTLIPKTNFFPDTYYRVVVSGILRAGFDMTLSKSGANYGSNFSWVFKTKDAVCAISDIKISPEERTFTILGERGEFRAQAYSEPDECDALGQALNMSGYTWEAWTEDVPVIADILDPGMKSEALPEWCASDCLRAGSPSPSAICGLNNVEASEDCDGGNAAPYDGCSSACLNEGSTTLCGDNVKGVGEDCDKGKRCSDGKVCSASAECANIGDKICKPRDNDGDGCSANCLNEGFVSATVCPLCECGGGGTPEPGEDCDDGNTTSGDGCSANCLHEGSVPMPYAICGNGVKTVPYEECDDGKKCSDGTVCTSNPALCANIGDKLCRPRDGDGCSSVCLLEEITAATCGNGSLNTPEECDDGNKVAGDGCSAGCLNEGSSYLGTPVSVCGDGVITHSNVTGGEECDVPSGITLPASGPYAITTVRNDAASLVDLATGIVATKLKASAEGEEGFANLTLECSCSDDASCGAMATKGCGEANCCYGRPTVLALAPSNRTSVCLNAAVNVTFSEKMDADSFLNVGGTTVERYVYLQLLGFDADGDGVLDREDADGDGVIDTGEDANGNGILDPGETVTSANCPASYEKLALADESRNLVGDEGSLGRAMGWIAGGVARVFLNEARAFETVPVTCILPTTYSGDSTVDLNYQEALQENGIYQLVVEGLTSVPAASVMSANGVALYNQSSSQFVAGNEICTLDLVEVTDQGKAVVSEFDEPSPGFFSELGEQHTLKAAAYTLNGASKEEIIRIPGVYDWSWDWSGTSDLVIDVPTDVDNTTNTATAGGNGEITAFAKATVTGGGTVIGETNLTAFLCENPWPAVPSAFPFRDNSDRSVAFDLEAPWTNFGFYYCRDAAGGPLLPEITAVQAPASPNPDIRKEMLFIVNGTGDALGVRVSENADLLPIGRWYAEQEFTGGANATTLDGYEAVQSGTTLYVNAANQGGTADIYSNIYVISFNADAGEASKAIFEQILSNWIFNANTDVISDFNVCAANYCATTTEQDCSTSAGCPEIVNATGHCSVTTGTSCSANAQCPQAACNTAHCSNDATATCDINGSSQQCYFMTAGPPPMPSMGNCLLDCAPSETCVFDSPTEHEQCVPKYLTDVKTSEMLSCAWDEECRSVTYSDGTPGAFPAAYCDAEKAKLTRDLTRLTDMRDMELTIEAYGDVNRHCSVTKGRKCFSDSECPGAETCLDEVPGLPAGSFVREFTTSVWPSWAAVLGNVLGTALPLDPINAFVGCSADADKTTCFNESAGTFACNEGSHVYTYQNVGGEAYKLSAQLEYEGGTWKEDLDTDPTDTGTLSTDAADVCDGTPIGESEICGDGILGPAEICEIGQTASDAKLASLGYAVTSPCRVCVNNYQSQFDGDSCTTNGMCGDSPYVPGTDFFCAQGTTAYACAIIDNACDWNDAAPSACIPYECGNGVVDPLEICDDGALNGTYGYCDENCSLTGAFFCGDGSIAGGEECDCGENLDAMDTGSWSVDNCSQPNGQYAEDYAQSCAFDCSFPGPSCGDGLINNDEQCDGGFEQWAGALCDEDDLYAPCETDGDCQASSCGNSGLEECGTSKICVGGADAGEPCTIGATCVSGACSAYAYDLYRYRTCDDEIGTTPSCDWNVWSPCMGGDQVCGNGTVEGDEECDGTDDCTSACQLNVCGDGSLYVGVESCDAGSGNGVACSPEYEGACVYCSVNCQFTTVSGAFCGDAIISGTELCDTANVYDYCYVGNSDPELRSVGTTCSASAPCAAGTGTCSAVGVCNGGSKWNGIGIEDFNGAPCVVGSSSATEYCGEANGHGAAPGECVAYTCADDCGSTCPAQYSSVRLQAQSEAAGAPKTDSITLYSYLSGQSPDQGILYMPACEVGTGITADVDASGWDGPSVDIVFVTDLSGSMNESFGSSTRIGVTVETMTASIEQLFAAFAGNSSALRIGTVGYINKEITGYNDDRDPCVKNNSSPDPAGLAWIDAELGSTETQIVNDSKHGIIQYPSVSVISAGKNAGTPTSAGLTCAGGMLAKSSYSPSEIPDRRIVVLMSDGAPTSPIDRNILDDDPDTTPADTKAMVNEVAGVRDALIADGIEIYTAALTSSPSLKSYMAHWSSDTCGDSKLGPARACNITRKECEFSYDCSDGVCHDDGLTCDLLVGDDDCEQPPLVACFFECSSGGICPCTGYGFCTSKCPTSNTCDAVQTCDAVTDPYVSIADCERTDDIEYAYAGNTAEALSAMYTSIIDTILKIRLTFTYTIAGDTVTTDGSIMGGTGVKLPFPAGFACQDTEFQIPLRLKFDGAGAVTLSNFQMLYCPIE